MRIVIPTNDKKGLDSAVAEHFGRCRTYIFLDDKGNVIKVIDNTSEHMGGSGLPPELMKKHGADVLLCKDLGMRALKLCQELEIDVYTSNAETSKEIYNQWKENKITKATSEDVCGH